MNRHDTQCVQCGKHQPGSIGATLDRWDEEAEALKEEEEAERRARMTPEERARERRAEAERERAEAERKKRRSRIGLLVQVGLSLAGAAAAFFYVGSKVLAGIDAEMWGGLSAAVAFVIVFVVGHFIRYVTD
jgi:hypothetical protein